jgi:hypothetical protein
MREAALLSDVGKLNFVGTLGSVDVVLPERSSLEVVHALSAESILCVRAGCCVVGVGGGVGGVDGDVDGDAVRRGGSHRCHGVEKIVRSSIFARRMI